MQDTILKPKYILTIWLKDRDVWEDEDPEVWDETEYFDTRADAEKAVERYKRGEHRYYGNSVVVDDFYISDEPEMIECFNW